MAIVKNKKITAYITFFVVCAVSFLVSAENIDPDNDDSQYAYGENIGWLNWEPGIGGGVDVYNDYLDGYIWAENIGWINVNPASYGGVENDGNGNLSGYAWGENVGWINFSPAYGGVTIDEHGNIEGWAWGENIGWIHLRAAIKCNVDQTGATQMTLNWNSMTGGIYDLYSTSDLVSWTLEQSDVASGGATTNWVDNAATGNRKFYRIRQTSPASYGVKTSW